MKAILIRAALVAATLSAFGWFGCSSAPEEPDLASAQQALIPVDSGWDPEPEPTTPPPPPPPPPTTSCSNITNDGVCRRYCCTTSSTFKRCGVLPCPTSKVLDTAVFNGGLLMAP